MAKKTITQPWAQKVINHAQIAGIETSTLDDGLGRNVRIAWVNTGTPLRYKLVLDRALDIADAFYAQHSLAWLSHAGVIAPRPDSHQGAEWLYTFGGGLLVTCGLTHHGGPESDEFGQRGVHGRISNLPAEIESIIQPNLNDEKPQFSITGIVKQSRVFGPNLELRRTIAGTVGQPALRISDVVTNRGNTPTPHMILYHCNFGYPLVDDTARFVWKGPCKSRGLDCDDAFFASKHDYKKILPPQPQHVATGEGVGFIDPQPDAQGFCTAGIHNPKLDFAVALRFKKAQLPCLTNWQHWGPGEYVTGLEPGTNPPIGQAAARQQKKLIHLKPGQSRRYELEVRVLTEKQQIQQFLKLNK